VTARALACAWPSLAVAALVLLPFLNTPFTIDDPIYLSEARHVLSDPLHPQAFSMVWSTDLNLRVSQILPGGIAVPYLLVPAALTGCAEWAGHLTQLLLLLAAVYAIALAALRLGLDPRHARLAALLTATCPAVLGMAGTVMPDVAAMLFAALGMERIAAWRVGRRWQQAMLATLWLALATLTRTHTLLILPAAFVLLLDGITRDEIRASLHRFPARFLPLLLTPAVFLAVSLLTADPESEGNNILTSMLQLEPDTSLMAKNLASLLAHYLIVIPLTISWILVRGRQAMLVLLLISGIASVLTSHWIFFAALASFVMLLDIFSDAIARRDRVQLALWLWLLLALPVIVYIHLPSKYLLPSVPAVAILIARREPPPWLVPSVAAAGLGMGCLILVGTRSLAETQRKAVADLVVPQTRAARRVWFSGHWGFQWYAEAAGARPVTLQPVPTPVAGDIIVVSFIDLPRFPQTWTAHKVLQRVTYPNTYGRVMDLTAGAGFFSSVFGYLPWVPGSGDANTFEVWRVEPSP
jgi:hypothetical protein